MAFSFLTQELAIDLGTANTVIFQNDNIVLDEPSIVAIDNNTGKCIALGQKAKLMHERTNPGIKTVRPMKDGVIADFEAAEMMIRRTVRVFPLPWKGLCLICLVCMLMVLAAETDVTGYEKRVPDMNSVDHVEFCYDTVYTEPENIRLVTELHRELIADKQLYDGNSEGVMLNGETVYHANGGETEELDIRISFWVPITYFLQNGRTVQRVYTIRFIPHDVDRPNTTIGRIVSLLNTQEGIQSRMKTALPMKEKYVNYAVINRETINGTENSYRLTPQETVELWNMAMLPDAEEGNLSLYTIVDTEENMKTQTNLRIDINLFDETRMQAPYYWGHSYRVFTFSEHCLDWIEAHTKLEWETLDVVTAEREND